MKYENALDSAQRTIPAVQEFVTLYPNHKIFFSYFTGEMGPTTLNIQTALHDRYLLDMRIPVYLDQTRTRVVRHDPPTIFLRECRAVTLQPRGSVAYESRSQRQFGPDDWEKIVKTRGDLHAVGVKVIKDRPVPNFDQAWQTWEPGSL